MPAPRTDLDADKIVTDYLSGLSLRALGVKHGCSSDSIRRVLSLREVPIRGQSEAGVLRAQRDTEEVRDRRIRALSRATKGVPKSADHRSKIATTKHRNLSQNIGVGESAVAEALRERGFDVGEQAAVGPYNLDLTLDNIDIEIHTDTHGPHLDRFGRHRRVDYLSDRGWQIIYVWCFRGITADDLDYVVREIEAARSNPPAPGEYTVIRCQGTRLPRRGADRYDRTFIATTGSGSH